MISEVYFRACVAYSKTPNDEQAKAWTNVLEQFPPGEVRAALLAWQRDTSPNSWGEPCGARMPSPADLKLRVEKARQVQRSSSAQEFVPCGKCEEGWIRVEHGKTVGGHEINPQIGAMKRCECWWEYLCRRYACSRAELPGILRAKNAKR